MSRERVHVTLALMLLAVRAAVSAEPDVQLRERAQVMVGGRDETWELRWLGKTEAACGIEDVQGALVGTCSGFAYGQRGHLRLVRLAAGQVIDQLDLDPFFGLNGDDVPGAAYGAAFLQQREFLVEDATRARNHDTGLQADILRRPVVKVMQFADYDRDGQASEFLLQIGTEPSTRRMLVLIGVSQSEPRLHVFSSAADPARPLVAGVWVWEALQRSSGTVDVIEWRCADHGGDIERSIQLRVARGVIQATRSSRQCP